MVGKTPTAPETLALVPGVEFLPDAMVLEAEWRERTATAHRLESARGGLGGGPEETDAFLLAARRALFLGVDRQRRATGPGDTSTRSARARYGARGY